MGKTKEQYLKKPEEVAIAMILLAVVMIAAATYYNFGYSSDGWCKMKRIAVFRAIA